MTGRVQASDKSQAGVRDQARGPRNPRVGAGRAPLGVWSPGAPWPHSACSGGVTDSPQGWGRRGGCRASRGRCPAPHTTGPSQSSARCGPGRWPPTGAAGVGSLSCSRQMAIRFLEAGFLGKKAGNTGHHPLTIDWGGSWAALPHRFLRETLLNHFARCVQFSCFFCAVPCGILVPGPVD